MQLMTQLAEAMRLESCTGEAASEIKEDLAEHGTQVFALSVLLTSTDPAPIKAAHHVSHQDRQT